MELRQIFTGKTDLMDLLLLGDEQEQMVMGYLERGEMAALFDGEDAIAVSVVTKEGKDLWELKNIAVLPAFQGKGYGKKLVRFWQEKLREKGILQVGTGETPKTMGFYETCGFQFSHRIADFFVHHYDHPIEEDGILLKDMVYFSYKL